jgi:hypothetical protein
MPFTLKRRHFPIRLAFAMTINKSQGQTLDKVGLFLNEPVFAHGQLYVAFSRVRTLSDIKVQLKNRTNQGNIPGHPNDVYTQNVVYTQVL